MFNFEKLDVWQKSIDFADFIYSLSKMLSGLRRSLGFS
jgi:hypothetical protein